MDRQRVFLLGRGSVILILLICLILRGRGEGKETDPGLARIQKLESKKDVPGLTAAIGDPDPKVGARAATVLARVAGKQAQAALQQAMKDSRPEIRVAATEAYGDVGDRNQVGVINELMTGDSSPSVRVAACLAAGRLYAWNCVEPLVKALDDPDKNVRQAASMGMQKILGLKTPNYQAGADAASRKKAIAEIQKMIPRAQQQYQHYLQQLDK
jgi:HEAT repeat protein